MGADDGEAELIVRWRNHSAEHDTWQPLDQLIQNVPDKVKAFVSDIADPTLTQLWQEAVAAVRHRARELRAAQSVACLELLPRRMAVEQLACPTAEHRGATRARRAR